MKDDTIKRSDAIRALIEWYGCKPDDIEAFEKIIENILSADRPQLAKDIVEPINNGNVIMSEDTYEDLLDRPQGRYIDADALVTVYLYDHEHEDDYTECMSVEKCLDLLTEEGCPKTSDRPQGEWIDAEIPLESGGSMPIQVCNLCKTFYPLAYTGGGHRFCPNCGARMKGADDETIRTEDI